MWQQRWKHRWQHDGFVTVHVTVGTAMQSKQALSNAKIGNELCATKLAEHARAFSSKRKNKHGNKQTTHKQTKSKHKYNQVVVAAVACLS